MNTAEDRARAREEAGRAIAEMYANMPSPQGQQDQADALADLMTLSLERATLAEQTSTLIARTINAVRVAYKAGVPRSLIADTLGMSVQRIWDYTTDKPQSGSPKSASG